MNSTAWLVALCAFLVVMGIVLAGSMNHFALVFMLSAWLVVLGILVWSFAKLLKLPPPDHSSQPPTDAAS